MERKPNIKRQCVPDISVELGMLRHLNVGRKYRDQECDEADAGDSSSPWNQHADPAEELADAAGRNEQGVIRQITRHDPEVKTGVYEVIGAGCDKEYSEQNQRDGLRRHRPNERRISSAHSRSRASADSESCRITRILSAVVRFWLSFALA